jgi:hypothetical protein
MLRSPFETSSKDAYGVCNQLFPCRMVGDVKGCLRLLYPLSLVAKAA